MTVKIQKLHCQSYYNLQYEFHFFEELLMPWKHTLGQSLAIFTVKMGNYILEYESCVSFQHKRTREGTNERRNQSNSHLIYHKIQKLATTCRKKLPPPFVDLGLFILTMHPKLSQLFFWLIVFCPPKLLFGIT